MCGFLIERLVLWAESCAKCMRLNFMVNKLYIQVSTVIFINKFVVVDKLY